MKVNIYYGGRGLMDDPTLYVINKMQEALEELNVKVERFMLNELKNSITTLPQTLKDADGIILATTVEWYGIGGYMQQFLDACWLYGDKEKISKIFYRPLDLKVLVEELEKEVEGIQSEQRKKNILLVDDDIAYLKTIKNWMSDLYHISIVSSGMQAITFIAKNKPDLILLDYEMPVTSGPKVLEMIRSEVDSSDIPVIFLTGKGDKESVTKVIELRPDGYILKNTGREKLREIIEDFFEQRKAKSY